MHHAAAQDLQPAGALADLAALAAADEALHVHLAAGLGEREVGGAQAGADLLAEHAAGKIDQRALQVAKGDALRPTTSTSTWLNWISARVVICS